MNTSINERIRQLIDMLGYKSVRQFALKIDVAPTSLNDIVKNNAEPKFSTLDKIITAEPSISSDWLITGKGEMLKVDAESGLTPVVNNKPAETRPRIPYTAAAGSLTSAVEGIIAEQCEQIPRIVAFPDYDFTIVIKGNSMEPKYEGGDEVACKRIDNTSFIQWGKVHVLDTAQGIIIKRVYEDGDNIRCTSYNPEYPDFSICKNEIYSMSLVVGLLRM